MNFSENRRFLFIPLGYTALFMLLLVALWNPSAPLGAGPIDLLLLLDESKSIAPERNNEVWKLFLQHAKSLPAGSRISLMRFAGRARIEIPWTAVEQSDQLSRIYPSHPPRRLLLDPSATDISLGVKAAIQFSSPKRHTAILISSDGIDSMNPLQSYTPFENQNPDLALFLLQSINPQLAKEIKIESINLPSASSPGLIVPVSIALESSKHIRSRLEVLLNDSIASVHSLSLKSAERRIVRLDIAPSQSAIHTLDFILRDQQGHIIEQHKRLLDNRDKRNLLFIGNRFSPVLDTQLQRGGWKISRFTASQLPAQEDFFDQFDVILLDDLPADKIDEIRTRNLASAVAKNATGLIVLGGPHSYASGGYRHSTLETMLPVTAEASRPMPGAAIVFLVDKSGSMDAANNNENRLANALLAVRETAKSLRQEDEIGLLVFDREVETLLPLLRRTDPLNALKQPWKLQASGGTLLAPALKQAIEILSQSDSKQRFLILVTDGFIDLNDPGSLINLVRQADIKIIALAIGSNTDLAALQQLVDSHTGRLLHINNSAQLPAFMRQQLEASHNSWNGDPATPRNLLELPFMNQKNVNWHELNGYQITRPKPSATVYISTDEGDPLLATGQYGAGRVAALPGGLLKNSSDENWISELLSWLDSHQPNPHLKISHRRLNGKLNILVDAVDSGGNWHPASEAEITLTDPAGITFSRRLVFTAPGRFTAEIENPAAGVYRTRIEIGGEHAAYNFYLGADRESNQRSIVPWLERGLSTGYIRSWPETGLKDLLTSWSGQVSTRPFWLILALISYLALIVFERGSGFKRLLSILPIFNKTA